MQDGEVWEVVDHSEHWVHITRTLDGDTKHDFFRIRILLDVNNRPIMDGNWARARFLIAGEGDDEIKVELYKPLPSRTH